MTNILVDLLLLNKVKPQFSQGSSGYDSTDEDIGARARSEPPQMRQSGLRAARSEDFLGGSSYGNQRVLQDVDRRKRTRNDNRFTLQDDWQGLRRHQQHQQQHHQPQQHRRNGKQQLRAASSEADLLHQSR